MRAEERYIRDVIQAALGVEVCAHDDGSADAMYDLRVGSAAAPLRVIEVTSAACPAHEATANAAAAESPLKVAPDGCWVIELVPAARIKQVKKELSGLLEMTGLQPSGFLNAGSSTAATREVCAHMRALGVKSVYRGLSSGAGRAYLEHEHESGIIGDVSDFVSWLSEFIRGPKLEDVRRKLQSPCADREAAIFVRYRGAPFRVTSYLAHLAALPDTAPVLPSPLTGVWVVPEISFHDDWAGLRYGVGGWRAVPRPASPDN